MKHNTNLPIKESYDLTKLPISEKTTDKELKEIIEKNITNFLITLGRGFSFKGKNIPIKLNGHEFTIGLLFYHIDHKRYLSLDVYIGEFSPESVGRINAELNAIESHYNPENSPVGLILCKQANKIEVKYALRGVKKGIAVAEYEIKNNLSRELENEIPKKRILKKIAFGKIPGSNSKGINNQVIRWMVAILVMLLFTWVIIDNSIKNSSNISMNLWLFIGFLESIIIPISLIIPLYKHARWLIGTFVVIAIAFLTLYFK